MILKLYNYLGWKALFGLLKLWNITFTTQFDSYTVIKHFSFYIFFSFFGSRKATLFNFVPISLWPETFTTCFVNCLLRISLQPHFRIKVHYYCLLLTYYWLLLSFTELKSIKKSILFFYYACLFFFRAHYRIDQVSSLTKKKNETNFCFQESKKKFFQIPPFAEIHHTTNMSTHYLCEQIILAL